MNIFRNIQMKEPFPEIITFVIIFCTSYQPTNGLMKHLSIQAHEIPNTLAYNRYIIKNPHRAKFLFKRQNLSISQVGMNDTGILLLTNITIGTPPQHFLVEVDLWVDSEFSVIGSNTNLSKVNSAIPVKNTYNSSASCSFYDVKGNYTNWCGTGHLEKDLLHLDNLRANITFGVIDELGYNISAIKNKIIIVAKILATLPAYGTLGLSPKENSGNNISLINQLVNLLDKPIFSFFSNRVSSGLGNSFITLGAEDTENCQTNWIYVPQEGDWCDVHTTSASAMINGTKVAVQINTTLAVLPYSTYISVPNSVKILFINSSNAVYNKSKKLYQVNCDVSVAGNVTFYLGGHDNVVDSTSRSLELSGADYIRYNSGYNLCYLAVYGYKDTSSSYNYIEIPHQFFNNHCIAYNIQNRQLGFADTIVPHIYPKKYSS